MRKPKFVLGDVWMTVGLIFLALFLTRNFDLRSILQFAHAATLPPSSRGPLTSAERSAIPVQLDPRCGTANEPPHCHNAREYLELRKQNMSFPEDEVLCEDHMSGCHWYSCAEQRLRCARHGEEHSMLKDQKYCVAWTNVARRMSSFAPHAERIRECLIHSAMEMFDVQSKAFAAQPDRSCAKMHSGLSRMQCYIQAGACTFNQDEWGLLLNTIREAEGQNEQKAVAEVVLLAEECEKGLSTKVFHVYNAHFHIPELKDDHAQAGHILNDHRHVQPRLAPVHKKLHAKTDALLFETHKPRDVHHTIFNGDSALKQLETAVATYVMPKSVLGESEEDAEKRAKGHHTEKLEKHLEKDEDVKGWAKCDDGKHHLCVRKI